MRPIVKASSHGDDRVELGWVKRNIVCSKGTRQRRTPSAGATDNAEANTGGQCLLDTSNAGGSLWFDTHGQLGQMVL